MLRVMFALVGSSSELDADAAQAYRAIVWGDARRKPVGAVDTYPCTEPIHIRAWADHRTHQWHRHDYGDSLN